MAYRLANDKTVFFHLLNAWTWYPVACNEEGHDKLQSQASKIIFNLMSWGTYIN